MKDLLKLTALQPDEIYKIFHIADEISQGNYGGYLKGKSVVLFFPASSIRTRVTFEKGNISSGRTAGVISVRNAG